MSASFVQDSQQINIPRVSYSIQNEALNEYTKELFVEFTEQEKSQLVAYTLIEMKSDK